MYVYVCVYDCIAVTVRVVVNQQPPTELPKGSRYSPTFQPRSLYNDKEPEVSRNVNLTVVEFTWVRELVVKIGIILSFACCLHHLLSLLLLFYCYC